MRTISIKFGALISIIISFTLLSGCSNEPPRVNSALFDQIKKKIEELPPTDSVKGQLTDSLLSISELNKNHSEKILALILKSEYLMDNGKNDEALIFLERAEETAHQTGDQTNLGRIFENIGRIHYRKGETDEAVSYFREAVGGYRAVNDSTGMGSAYNNAGFAFWQKSLFDSSLILFNEALKIRETLHNADYLATTLNNIGTVYFNWSLYDKALEYYLRALKLQQIAENPLGISISLSNIGLVYKETRQYEEAIEFYKKSIENAIKAKDTSFIGYAYQGIGNAYQDMKNDSAGYFLNLSLENYRNTKDLRGIMLGLLGVGSYNLKKGNFADAQSYLNQMLVLADSEKIPLRKAEALVGLGKVKMGLGDLQAAKNYFNRAVEPATEVRNLLLLSEVYENLGKIYDQQGAVDSSLASFKKHLDYSNQINEEEKDRRLTGLKNKVRFQQYEEDLQNERIQNQIQLIVLFAIMFLLIIIIIVAVVLYRFYKKQTAINKELSEKNEMIRQQTEALESANLELKEVNLAKERLFSIIAHDLRSPFQVILGFTEMLLTDINDMSDEEKTEQIEALYQTATSSYRLVENLLHLSAAKAGTLEFKPEKIELAHIIGEVATLSEKLAAAKKVKLFVSTPEELELVADSNMLTLILRNLINNSIKYCNPGDIIQVSACAENDAILIKVKDTGSGMTEETLNNLLGSGIVKSQRGTSGEKGTGLGLDLSRDFAKKHGGDILIESTLDVGTTVTVILPVANESSAATVESSSR